jgi:hypothetical protein
MKARQYVDPSVFVIRRRSGSAIADRMDTLRELGNIVPLGGHADRCLLRVRSQSKDPKETWRRLRERLGSEFDLEPALIDDRGRASYPTGTVTVRFEKVPTDDELNDCERQWSMRVKARNQYAPSQVTFEKTESVVHQYLPDVLESIQHDTKRVRAVWPETISKYLRSQDSC